MTAIFGPSGPGKTTLLDAVAGLRDIATGEIEIGGKTLFSSARKINLSPQRRNIGYVPQEGASFPHLSVRRIFSSAPSASFTLPAPKASAWNTCSKFRDRSSPGPAGDQTFRRRGAARRACPRILSRPQLLLLDEPLAALDIGLEEKILPYLAGVATTSPFR